MPRAAFSGKKVEIVPLDNKTNPQESLIQAQKAIDAGVRYITQGNGSSVAGALTDFVTKYNERNPGKEVLYFNYAAMDPVLTNAKCSRHFRWDATRHQDGSAHELHEECFSHQEALPDQPGLFVRWSVSFRSKDHAEGEAAGDRDRRRRTASAAEDNRLRTVRCEDQGVWC
jgi:hypothetical protein